jgi:hypothetical protein
MRKLRAFDHFTAIVGKGREDAGTQPSRSSPVYVSVVTELELLAFGSDSFWSEYEYLTKLQRERFFTAFRMTLVKLSS